MRDTSTCGPRGERCNLDDVDLQALARTIVLIANLLAQRQHSLGAAEVDDDVAGFNSLHDAGDDVARLLGVLAKDDVALGLP